MFDRTLKILDKSLLETIQKQNILLVGVGGVGGFALESLIRLGFFNITIIDSDKVEISNLNRQIISNRENIGKFKVDEAKKRCLIINPNSNITTFPLFLNNENIDEIFNEKFDFIIDACDTVQTKVLLIKKAQEQNIPIISSMGMGNRLDPSKVVITKLNKTYNDPLAKTMRYLLRKENMPLNIPVIWSSEVPIKTKEKTLGSILMPPASAGLEIAYFILDYLINNC